MPMNDRAAAEPRSIHGHGFAFALGLLLAAPLVAAAVVASAQQYPGGGRMLAIAAPWVPDVQVIDALGGRGAAWAVPLRVSGMWLVEIEPVAGSARAPRPQGVVLVPIAEGWETAFGCAASLRSPRRARHASDDVR